MNKILFRKRVRAIAARLGILRPLRAIVFRLRGVTHDDSEVRFLRRFIGPKSLVFDVGANRGQSSENYIKLGARVIAFEPQEDLHPEISQLCHNSPRLIISSCGLGSAEENKRMFLSSYDQAASLRENWEGDKIGEKTIHVSTLDRQIEIHGIPYYCKIDVEGWEIEVLRGLNTPIQIISFEYHLTPEEIDTTKKVISRVREIGCYYCNLKQSSDHRFLLDKFIIIDEFYKLFPEQLNPPPDSGYGDIFCVLDPSVIRDI